MGARDPGALSVCALSRKASRACPGYWTLGTHKSCLRNVFCVF